MRGGSWVLCCLLAGLAACADEAPPSTNAPRARIQRSAPATSPEHGSLAYWARALASTFSGVLTRFYTKNAPTNVVVSPERGYVFIRDRVSSVPWSIHVVKISRAHAGIELDTALGRGRELGMATVSEQARLIPREAGTAVAAINGDMFQYRRGLRGDPDGLQIARGELVSGPHPARVCFWVDGEGNPHRTNVQSRFHIVWPDGTQSPFGLNEYRMPDEAVLYTRAVGFRTGAFRGTELVLGPQTNAPWLPLKVGQFYSAVVLAVNTNGNSALASNTLVLSLGPAMASRHPGVAPGAVLRLSTATIPDLAGARTAIGGGPTLVHAGKPWNWSEWVHFRHPRSALGWNKDCYFLVQVDGRQLRSVGMTFAELATYLVRLGCQEAINLDGGGSATLWVDGRVVNSPSQGGERPAANSVVLLVKPKK